MRGRASGTITRISKEKESEFFIWLKTLKNNPLPYWKKTTSEQWKTFIQSTIDKYDCIKTASLVNVHKQTIYRWRRDLALIFNGEKTKRRLFNNNSPYFLNKGLDKGDRRIGKWLFCKCKANSEKEYKDTIKNFKEFLSSLKEQPKCFYTPQEHWEILVNNVIKGNREEDIAEVFGVTKQNISLKIRKLVKLFKNSKGE